MPSLCLDTTLKGSLYAFLTFRWRKFPSHSELKFGSMNTLSSTFSFFSATIYNQPPTGFEKQDASYLQNKGYNR